MSSLSRAFTTRKARLAQDGADHPKVPQRSMSTRDHKPQVLRHQISGPVQLVHTTNMLSYNAPDLPRKLRNKPSIQSSLGSETPSTAESTPPTSPEVSPVEECPGPLPNHLSTYFMIPEKAQIQAAISKADAPAIPQRSPSHTKKNSYDAIARQRSVSRMSKESDRSVSTKASFSFSRSSSTSTRASSTSSATAPQVQKLAPPPLPTPAPLPPSSFQQRPFKESQPNESHPFGKELAQVTELAEEYAAKANSKIDEEDDIYLKSHQLSKFSAADYLGEVQNLINQFFPEVAHVRTTTPIWI